MFSPTTQMGSCVEPNWTDLYDKILGIENQVTKLQELYDGRITNIEDAIAKLQQPVQKSEQDDTIGNHTFNPEREGGCFYVQQESCSAKIQPQSEASSPNPLREVNEHVDANPTSSFSPGLVDQEHYGDQEGLHNNTVPKRLNGETAREETTPKGVASAAVGGDKPPGDEGLQDDTIPKNLNEEGPTEENTPTAAASTVGEPPENEPPGGNSSSDTGLNLTQNVPQTPQIPENCFAECTARQGAERGNGERHCNGMQQQSTNTKRDFKKYIEDGRKRLENRNRKAIRENLSDLIWFLYPVIDDVVLHMFSHFVLSDCQREKIASKTNERDKCEHLVTNVLLHSSEKTFWVFIQALEDNHCEFIVDQLLGKPDDVTGHIRAIVDILEERKTSDDAQIVSHTVDEYIFNNPDISRLMADAIRNALAEQNLIVTGLSRGSILINMKFYTVEQLDAFWMWVKSRRPSPISTSLTEVILTEEIRSMFPENLVLSLSTNMDLDEYLKKRRILLHGDLQMTSDDSNFRKHPLKEGTQNLSWLDIAGKLKEEANPKVLLEWAFESGYNDPLPLLTEKFPRTFTGYDEKDFRIERLHKLIIYQNGRISQMNEKCEELENNLLQTANDLKKAQDTLEEKNQYIKNLSIHRYSIPAVPVPKSEGNFVEVPTQETSSYDSKQPNENEGRPQQASANRPSYREEPKSVASESFPTDSGGTKATPVAVEERPKQAAVSKQSFDTQVKSVTSQGATTDTDGSEVTPTAVSYVYDDIHTTLLFDQNRMTLGDAKNVACHIIRKMEQCGVTEDVRLFVERRSSSKRDLRKLIKAIHDIRPSERSTLVQNFTRAMVFTTNIASDMSLPRTEANQLNRLIVLSGVPMDDTSEMVNNIQFVVTEKIIRNTQIHFLLFDDEPNVPTGTPRKQITSQRTDALEHCRQISALTNGSTILLRADEEGTCQDKVDSWFERTWRISSSAQKHPSLKAGHTQLSPDPNGEKSYLMTRGISSSAQKHPGLKTLKAGLMESSPDPDYHNPYLMMLDRPHVKK